MYLNISIALIVFMGLVSGGMLALVLMTTRRYQVSFSIILGLAALLALAGMFSAVSFIGDLAEGLANAVVLLVLAFALGYTLTTFSVLSHPRTGHGMLSPKKDGHTAVICLAQGEPPQFGVESASLRLALADDQQDVPQILLRPFYLRDLRTRYAIAGRSPYREYHTELAHKVQSRLDSSYRVYMAYYSDKPALNSTIQQAITEGAARIRLVHLRVTDPPDPVKANIRQESLILADSNVGFAEVGPLWEDGLLAQIYVRRVLESVPQVTDDPHSVGLLLVGRGHATLEGETSSAGVRYKQERAFQESVMRALVKVGFDEKAVAIGWLRWNSPNVSEALDSLARLGCKSVLWMPSSFTADGIITLADIPAQLEVIARGSGIKLLPLGAWNADDLAAEEIAARVRASTQSPAKPLPVRSSL